MASRIEDYALIGDCQTAALVSRDGSIDWLCFPRFDSGACFAALLGTPDHGRWLIAPAEAARRVHRHYRPGTLILETEYETDSGIVSLIDWMPPRGEAPDVMRLVVGRQGTVPLRLELVIRFDYGSVVPWVQHTDDGIRATAGPDTLLLRTPVPLRGEDLRTARYPTSSNVDGLPPGEGAFLLCSFWLADNLALQGRLDEARAVRAAPHAAERRGAAGRGV